MAGQTFPSFPPTKEERDRFATQFTKHPKATYKLSLWRAFQPSVKCSHLQGGTWQLFNSTQKHCIVVQERSPIRTLQCMQQSIPTLHRLGQDVDRRSALKPSSTICVSQPATELEQATGLACVRQPESRIPLPSQEPNHDFSLLQETVQIAL